MFISANTISIIGENCKEKKRAMERKLKMQYYGTLGPACADIDILTAMFEAGMTGLRLNTSHGRLAGAAGWIEAAEKAAAAAGKKWKLLIDLKGPELRIGALKTPMLLEEGREVLLAAADGAGDTMEGAIPIPAEVLSAALGGQMIWLDDSRLSLRIESVDSARSIIGARVLTGGILQSHKSLAIDGVEISMPALTAMDLENIIYAGQQGPDFPLAAVMQPFVRSRQDLMDVRQALDSHGCGHVKIMAKIENRSGVAALPSLLSACDMVVIARGDLGTAVSLPELPVVQKEIEAICHGAGKPYMVVTQMLDSMMASPVPTRAEVSDIAHAVFCGAEALMLTGETAAGKYPAEAMKYLVATAEAAAAYIK